MPHADLEFTVHRWHDGGYAVDLHFRTAASETDAQLAIDIPIRLDLTQLLTVALDDEAYGLQLAAMLFENRRMYDAVVKVRGFVEGAGVPLRLRLRLDPGAPELHGIRWETLRDPVDNTPFGLSERVLVSRYLDSTDLRPLRIPRREEINALVVVASPTDLASYGLTPLDGEGEATRVRAALGDIPTATLISQPGEPPVTLNAIMDALHYGYDILYLVCHGVLREGVPYLYLQGEDGKIERVPGDKLARRIGDLREERRPLLVVLASCQSVGVSHESSTPAALGPQLAQAGVAAVLGMQGDVPLTLVGQLMPRFFRHLARGGEIDQALALARAALSRDEPWWMPVLFLRVRNGRLWQELDARTTLPTLVEPASSHPTPTVSSPPAHGPAPAARPRRAPWVIPVVLAAVLLALVGVALAGPAVVASLFPTATPPPVPTTVSLVAPTPLPTVALTPTPMVLPVGEDKYMVLVADLQQSRVADRDLAREIEEDLQRNVEALPFSSVQVRRYRGVVTDPDQAHELALANHAAVVLWGRADENGVKLNLQIGDPTLFPGTPETIDPATIAGCVNVTLSMPVEGQLKSPAVAVLAAFNVLRMAQGDTYQVLRIVGQMDSLKGRVDTADVTGQGTAVLTHRFLKLYYTQPQEAVPLIEEALRYDRANPLLNVYGATVYQRLDQYERADELDSYAASLAQGWAIPRVQLALNAYLSGDLPTALRYLDDAVAARPEDWFLLGYRGGARYLAGDLQAAQSDLARSIALKPETALPYTFDTIIALRQGRLNDAQGLAAQARRFGAQMTADNDFITALFGRGAPISAAVVAVNQLLAGQNSDVVKTIDGAMAPFAQAPPDPAAARAVSDLAFLKGVAECRRARYPEAEAAYSAAIAADPSFTLLYLLRAEARGHLGDQSGAQADVEAVTAAEPSGELMAAIASGQGCDSLAQGQP